MRHCADPRLREDSYVVISAEQKMRGLVIDEPWISLIISGEKTWEMRSRNTLVRGRIALIRKGSKTVIGTVDLVRTLPQAVAVRA
jgi:hypothetical protein